MTFLLSNQNVVQYLREQGISIPEKIEENQIHLKIAKNFNLLVHLSDHRKLIVKQERYNSQGQTAGEFLAEWRVQKLFQVFLELSPLRSLLPEVLSFDAESSILILNYLNDYCDLNEFYAKHKAFPSQVAAALGSAIAQIHRATFQDSTYQDYFCEGKPPANHLQQMSYNFERITPEIFGSVPMDGIKFFALYQRYDSLGKAIAGLVDSYMPCCLTHNDLKLNNVLLHLEWEQHQASAIRLIDWERANWGDPAADVGMIIASYLQLWLMSLVVSKETSIEESLRLAGIPLEQLQPSIAAFMQSYLQQFPEMNEENFVSRAVQFAGLALIQQIQAGIQYQKSFGNSGICLLQVAKSLLCRPEQAIETVFGCSQIELIQKKSVEAA